MVVNFAGRARPWRIGMLPLGGMTTVFVFLWTAIVLVSLVDVQSGQKLFMSLTLFDHAQRVDWAESILRTGIPPANPFYFFQHSCIDALLLLLAR